MRLLLLSLVLALIWVAATGSFSALNLMFGLAIAALVLFVLRDRIGSETWARRARGIGALAWYFLKQVFAGAVRVVLLVANPNLGKALNPAIVAVPIHLRTDAEIALLANLITLTPGTLSLDVSNDRSVLYIHVLALTTREKLIADVASGFEVRIAAVFA